MRRVSRVLVLFLAATVLLPGLVVAESTPAATKWLDKMASFYAEKSFSVNYDATMAMGQFGENVKMDMKGALTKAGKSRFRMNLTMSMTMPNSDQPLDIKLLGVSDGTVMWLEMENPMLGGRQVMKMPFAKIEELAASNPMVRNLTSMDPVAQIQELTGSFDFDVVEERDGTVTLGAEMTDEARQKFGASMPSGMPSEFGRFILVLDAASGFPSEIRLGQDDPVMVMHMRDTKILDAVADETFAYTPPDGVQVMDLGAMIESQGQQ